MNKNTNNNLTTALIIVFVLGLLNLFFWIGIIITIIFYASDLINHESILAGLGPIFAILALLGYLVIFGLIIFKKYSFNYQKIALIWSILPLGFVLEWLLCYKVQHS